MENEELDQNEGIEEEREENPVETALFNTETFEKSKAIDKLRKVGGINNPERFSKLLEETRTEGTKKQKIANIIRIKGHLDRELTEKDREEISQAVAAIHSSKKTLGELREGKTDVSEELEEIDEEAVLPSTKDLTSLGTSKDFQQRVNEYNLLIQSAENLQIKPKK